MFVRRLKEAGQGWAEDHAAQMGAALAYYTLFSLAPLLMIAIAVIGAFYGEAETRQRVVSQVREQVDEETAKAVEGMLESLSGKQAQTARRSSGWRRCCSARRGCSRACGPRCTASGG